MYNGDDVSRHLVVATFTFAGRVAIYFLRFATGLGARCDKTLAATALADLLALLLRSSVEATFATRGLVLRCATILLFPFPLDTPRD